MMSYLQEFDVPFRYPVVFTRGVFSEGNEELDRVLPGDPARVLFFLDDGVASARPELLREIRDWFGKRRERVKLLAPVQVVTGGERIKGDMRIVDRVGRLAAETGLCRHSYVIVAGGGAVLDAVGFAASLVHRGVRQVRLPTTVLSQDDSGVGVKNGLNRYGMKNYFGVFAPPFAVVNDAELLTTLSDRDWISGLAEAFKVAVIKDRELLDLLSESADAILGRDLDAMEAVVRRSAELHLDHIRNGGDPFETGTGRPLDFGHWAAHRLESMTDHELRHGEAVAVGVALDLYAATDLGLLDPADLAHVLSSMERTGLSLFHDALKRRDRNGRLEVLEGLKEFQEHLGGELTLAMPDGLGRKTDVHEMPEELVERCVESLKKRCRSARRRRSPARGA